MFLSMDVVEKWILLIVGIERFLTGLGIFEVRIGCCVVGFLAVSRELRDGNGCQDADDRDNDQQLDQGETFSATKLVQHDISPFVVYALQESYVSTLNSKYVVQFISQNTKNHNLLELWFFSLAAET
jgi:hypothetical protein